METKNRHRSLEEKQEQVYSPEERLISLYENVLNSSVNIASEFADIKSRIINFCKEPTEAFQYFSDFIKKVGNELPEVIPITYSCRFLGEFFPVTEKGAALEDKKGYYCPLTNEIYTPRESPPCDPQYDPESDNFVGLEKTRQYSALEENIRYPFGRRVGLFAFDKSGQLQEIPYYGVPQIGDFFPFTIATSNVDIDSICCIMDAIKPLLKTEEGKALLQKTASEIIRLKQQFIINYNRTEQEGIKNIKDKTSALLNAVRKQVANMPPYIRLERIQSEENVEPNGKVLYLLTKDCKLILVPTTGEKKLFVTQYKPDLSKAEDAPDTEWLRQDLPYYLLDILPKKIKKIAKAKGTI